MKPTVIMLGLIATLLLEGLNIGGFWPVITGAAIYWAWHICGSEK